MNDEAVARLRRAALAVCQGSWLQPSLAREGSFDDWPPSDGYWVVPDEVMRELVAASTAVEVADIGTVREMVPRQ